MLRTIQGHVFDKAFVPPRRAGSAYNQYSLTHWSLGSDEQAIGNIASRP